jgi:hypothetical protein
MNIVYLLGAGASANAIPIQNNIRVRINDLIYFLLEFDKKNSNNINSENRIILNKVKKELEWLLSETKNHQTIDTFAKKLFLKKNSSDILKLKRALINYFYFEQFVKFPPTENNQKQNPQYIESDLRYDSLFANIIQRNENNLSIEDNISIVTWNYDLQIELALKNYFELPLNDIKNNLSIHPNQKSYNLQIGDIVVDNKFKVFKLNGNAFFDSGLERGSKMTMYDHSINEHTLEKKIEIFLNEMKNVFGTEYKLKNHPAFKLYNFSWESYENSDSCYIGKNNVVESAKKVFDSCDILIIIGYSFPYFNSEIDKYLIGDIKIKELIIQDENPENIKQRLKQIFKQLNPPFHNQNPELKYTPYNISQYFPLPR